MVIPVVVYHGRRPWTAPRSMRDVYDADDDILDALGDRPLGIRIEIDDLRAASAASIAARTLPAIVRVVLGMLRDARDHTIGEIFAQWREPMLEAARDLGSTALLAVLGVSSRGPADPTGGAARGVIG